jgi:hypothetical protein
VVIIFFLIRNLASAEQLCGDYLLLDKKPGKCIMEFKS